MNQGRSWAVAALLAAVLLAGCSAQVQEPVEEATQEEKHPLRSSSFSWDPHFPAVGETVRFEPHVRSSASGDELRGFIWDFGDVQYTDSHPTYRFDTAGSHPVHLRIDTAKGGTWEIEQTVEVVAPAEEPPAPKPSAGTSREAPVAPPTILVVQDGADFTFSFEWSLAADTVHWDFGDGTTSTEAAPEHTYLAAGDFAVTLRVADGATIAEATTTVTVESVPFQPHVIVAIPDTGINPYHEMYRRPHLTEHPCTYIQDYPCDIPALNLTLDAGTWTEAFEADRAKWESIRPGQWFWIPQTVFIGVTCEYAYEEADGDICILDDSHMHGTGTTSSVIMENPDALIVFKEGGSSIVPIMDRRLPVDIYSVSWGYIAPIPAVGQTIDEDAIYVLSAGNDPRSTLVDGWAGDPRAFTVGGAYANGQSEEALAAKQPEVVSYFCRPTAQTRSLDEMRESYCGTSFAAPTVAGALSEVVLEVRRASGYLGGMVGPYVDPVQGITHGDIRDAMNRTASYDPEAQYSNSLITGIPLNPVAPWVQWGWGFYDGLVADATITHLLETPAPAKPDEAVLYMETVFLAKQATHPLS